MDSVLLHGEAEMYIQSLERMSVLEIGSPKWFRQHEFIEKLNMQAILNAKACQEEFIKDLFVSLGKVPTLVHSLILTEVWKHKLFPIICKLKDFNPKSTFQLYMVIHHEATIINLLETVMYHKESSESADDAVVDLVDYCHRKLTLLAGRSVCGEIPAKDRITHVPLSDATSIQIVGNSLLPGTGGVEKTDIIIIPPASQPDLQRQSDMLEFEISIKALSVLCYITDHIESLSLSVLTRMLSTHNLPCVLVQLVENCPWNRGKLEKYTEGKWSPVLPEDHLKLSKHDGQVWIALLNLILKPDCQKKYNFNTFNKNQLLKLRGYLTDAVIDQLPNLVDLKNFLSQLALTDPAPPKKDLILEQLPEIWNNIVIENSNKWKAIAKHQVSHFFNPSENDLREQASRLAETYNLDVMENLIPDKPKCGACGRQGAKRCSRCQGEWYCNRECQVKHWPKHKPVCQLMTDAIQKLPKELVIKS